MPILFNWAQLAEITRGQWRGAPLPSDMAGVERITDDSRQVRPGDLFVAIAGHLRDGHSFVESACQAGATAACVSKRRREAKGSNIPLLCVDNTLNAFHELARAHRRRFPGLDVVGITGSSGKTSVRCMLSAIVEHAWPEQTLSTLGNTNNHFGVPRNLLRLQPRHRVAVLEIGSNQPGEIAQLTRLIRPRIGLITNIGAAHLENFGGTLGVVMEKGCLLTGLQGHSVAVIPEQTEHIEILRQIIGDRPFLTFGASPQADVQAVYHGCDRNLCRLTLKWRQSGAVRDLNWHIGGSHQALNAAAAAAAATALEIEPDTIVEGLTKTIFPGLRMEILKSSGINWVNDAYNANPDSMRSGLEWFFELTAGIDSESCFLVLGDMLELGEDAPERHRELLDWVKSLYPADHILPTGPLMQEAARQCGLDGFADVEECLAALRRMANPGAWVFLKGSRSVGLERVVFQPEFP